MSQQNKEKFYILSFALSIICMVVSFGLKILGINFFEMHKQYMMCPEWVEFAVKTIIYAVQQVLIIGCITIYTPKDLYIKMIPFLPLNLILYYLPIGSYYNLSALLLFVTCMALSPKFSTVVRFVINIAIISLLQLIIIWLKLDIKATEPVFPSAIRFLIMNIDQLVILTLLYNFNRKWGEYYGLVISRRKEKTHIPR